MSEAEEYYFERVKELEAQLTRSVSMLQKVVDDGAHGVVPFNHLTKITEWLLDSSNKQAHLDAEILRCAEDLIANGTTPLVTIGGVTHKAPDCRYVENLYDAVRAKKED